MGQDCQERLTRATRLSNHIDMGKYSVGSSPAPETGNGVAPPFPVFFVKDIRLYFNYTITISTVYVFLPKSQII